MKLAVRLLLVCFLRAGRKVSTLLVQRGVGRRQVGKRAAFLTGERAGARTAGSLGRACPCQTPTVAWFGSGRPSV